MVTLQVVVDPHGKLVWISDGLPGSVQDLAAAHTHGLITQAQQAGLFVVADLAYANPVLTGYRRVSAKTAAQAKTPPTGPRPHDAPDANTASSGSNAGASSAKPDADPENRHHRQSHPRPPHLNQDEKAQ